MGKKKKESLWSEKPLDGPWEKWILWIFLGNFALCVGSLGSLLWALGCVRCSSGVKTRWKSKADTDSFGFSHLRSCRSSYDPLKHRPSLQIPFKTCLEPVWKEEPWHEAAAHINWFLTTYTFISQLPHPESCLFLLPQIIFLQLHGKTCSVQAEIKDQRSPLQPGDFTALNTGYLWVFSGSAIKEARCNWIHLGCWAFWADEEQGCSQAQLCISHMDKLS